ncbi:MAG TPA: winged helix-turn-helix domain-containing protein [Candidatus Acidoferrum sp.]|nr:winged helix-turn-helix domain-containing protein [Candidatus Acidoferrum sp.]
MPQKSPPPILRFGVFEVNFSAQQLRKHGIRVRLAGQPLAILAMLLERPGEVITREEMQRRLWASDTFVDFEHSLNSAIKKLRAALNDTPENSRYIETLPRVGYRFIAPVQEVSEKGHAAADASIAADRSGVLPEVEKSSHRRWPIILGIAIGLIGAGGAYFQWSHFWPRTQRTSGRLMLAVLPFDNLTGDAGQEYFSDGLTEEMIVQLGHLDPLHLGVIARTSVMHYKHGQQQLDQIGRELGVQYVLEGSVRRDANKVRISAQLIQMKDQTRLWARQYDRELSNLLVLQGEIAQDIAGGIQLTLDDQKRNAPAHQAALSPDAYESHDLYLKGRYFWNKRTIQGFQQAIEYFQQAIAKDPNSARAYAGLADSYALLGGYSMVPQTQLMQKARAAALKALQIDETLAEAHTSLALITENYDRDWQTAEKEYQRAIELNPNYATAHHWYAEYLTWQDRFDEAFRESERARQLDPLSLIIAADNAMILYYSRQYDRAIDKFRAVRKMEPDFPRAEMIINAYVEKGMFAEALAEAENVRRVHGEGPWNWSTLAYVHGRAGQPAEARHALENLKKQNRHQEIDQAALAWAYIALGDNEQAFGWLEKAYSQHSNAMITLKVEPGYDPLRSDPRFQDLLRRVGLAANGNTGQPTSRP